MEEQEEKKDYRIVEEKETLLDRFKNIQPKQLLVPVVVLVLFIGTIIGIVNYRQKTRREQNPKIEITSPTEGQTFEEAQIVVEGNTYPDTKILVDGKETVVDADGRFAAEVPVKEGLNEITITAESAIGKKAEAKRIVTRVSEKPAETQAAAPDVQAQPAKAQNLNSSGPENFWIPEILSLSGVGSAWYMSRRSLKKAMKK